jgi:hypothetical protein
MKKGFLSITLHCNLGIKIGTTRDICLILSIKSGLVYLLIYYIISTASELGSELKIIILVGSQFLQVLHYSWVKHKNIYYLI